MDGVAIYLGVASVFMAACCGIDLTMRQYFAIASCTVVMNNIFKGKEVAPSPNSE